MSYFPISSKPDIFFSLLEPYGELRTFPKNHTLITHGNIPQFCYLICHGQVIGYEILDSGNEAIYSIQERYALFAEANLLTKSPVPVSFKTTQPCELLCIDRPSLLLAMQNDSQLMTYMLEAISTKFIGAMDEVRNVKNHSAVWRLCELLHNFALRYGTLYDNKILIQERLSIQMFTSLLGVNRATTVRSLKLLRDLGLVEHINGYYCIRSLESLQRYQELLENMK